MTAATLTPAPSVWSVAPGDVPVTLAVQRGPDGDRVAVGGGSDRLVVLDVATGQVLGEHGVPDGVLVLRWSPDGTVLAAGGPRGARLLPAGGPAVPVGDAWCGALDWTPDGRLAAANGRRAVVVDAAGGPLWVTPAARSTVTGLHWLRDGRELAVAAFGGVRTFSRGRPGPVRSLEYAGSLLATDVTPDGRWLVSGNQDASIHVWRLRDGDELEMSGLPSKVTRLAFDGTGRRLAANGSPDTTVWDFSGRGPGGTAPGLLRAHPDGATAIAWQPGTQRVATGGADGTVAVWDAPPARPGTPTPPGARFTVGPHEVTSLAWAGDLLVAGLADGRVLALPAGAR